jgi:hypothetical protein
MTLPPRLRIFFFAPNRVLARLSGSVPLLIAALIVYPIIFRMAREGADRLQLIGIAVLGALGAVVLMMLLNLLFNILARSNRDR